MHGLITFEEHSHSSAIATELKLIDGEVKVRKTVRSVFFGTMLTSWLAQRGVESLRVVAFFPSVDVQRDLLMLIGGLRKLK